MICEIYLRKISKQLKRSNYLSINTYGIMEIEDKYQEYVDLARSEGYEPIARIKLYSNAHDRGDKSYDELVLSPDYGTPYLLVKPLGSILLLKVATHYGTFDALMMEKRYFPLNCSDNEVEVNAYFVENKTRYFFKKPF